MAPRPAPLRLIGLYALSRMEAEGSTYGYALARAISDRTQGGWRPGPGAIYPALSRLVERGLARRVVRGRRREFAITAPGRRRLARVRARFREERAPTPDLAILWVDIVGGDDPSEFLLRRLDRVVEGILARAGDPALPPAAGRSLRRRATRVLVKAQGRLAAPAGAARARGASR
jgi:DNA-binding PadR family transcriptional regulator